MTRLTRDNHDDAKPHDRVSPADPVVVLVVGLDARRELLSQAVFRIAPHARVETAGSAFDALMRATRTRTADLLVLDLALGGLAAPALIRHLARLARPTDVLVFDDAGQSLPGAVCDVRAWGELDGALRRWFDAWQLRATSRG
jgi:CheY-like chemotaxis protein